jgi:hypothetical protein
MSAAETIASLRRELDALRAEREQSVRKLQHACVSALVYITPIAFRAEYGNLEAAKLHKELTDALDSD